MESFWDETRRQGPFLEIQKRPSPPRMAGIEKDTQKSQISMEMLLQKRVGLEIAKKVARTRRPDGLAGLISRTE